MKGGPRAACCTWLSRRAAYWFRLRLKTVWLVCDVGRRICFKDSRPRNLHALAPAPGLPFLKQQPGVQVRNTLVVHRHLLALGASLSMP